MPAKVHGEALNLHIALNALLPPQLTAYHKAGLSHKQFYLGPSRPCKYASIPKSLEGVEPSLTGIHLLLSH
jgi:hypothetical protein